MVDGASGADSTVEGVQGVRWVEGAGRVGGAQDIPAGHAAAPGSTSRRQVLGRAMVTAAGAAVVGGGAGYGIARATDHASSSPAAPSASPAASAAAQIVPFYGAHQAGIATPAQDRLAFAAFDVTTTSLQDLQRLLGTWAAAAAQMTRGLPVGPVETSPQAPPIDTGEAEGLGAARLTVTVGFGPSLFDARFGLVGKRPAALADLPALPGDGALAPERSGGDLCVQACADDPVVAFHAIRNLARLARDGRHQAGRSSASAGRPRPRRPSRPSAT